MGRITKKYEWLKGKNMNNTAWGITSSSHGMYFECWDVYHYGIKGIFGLRITKEWGYNYK